MVNLTITPEAEKAFSQLSEDKRADFVRISAGQACGCGRIGYQMHWETERSPEDEELNAQGLVLLVDNESKPLLEGSVIDYKKEALSEGFYISNPNAPQGCGCGGH
ncbi:HesB/IscA family protein [Sulfobacillus harzensis]|uniref:Iron-sulfur cluster assembly accessory protein n=1 Tax=Sulfobacillus harzensis TaxID=2729629 RepID=A0A7Y0L2Y3_9FIRM|nr:iron-sulfur cluster assembly accessory protein [Sulfobacillus harzensis]NMP22317.1 iron-sulfur cluster assembly accessory protein [Sulfobacillus harzensis]